MKAGCAKSVFAKALLCLALTIAACPAQEVGLSGAVTVRRSTLGCPELSLRFPSLPEGEEIVTTHVLRSTTDLSKARVDHQYPVARLPMQPGQTAFMDTLAPQNVLLFYQLETKTTTDNTYFSNVETVYLPAAPVPRMKQPSLLVDKSAYVLLLLDGGVVKRRMPIALGANAVFRKLHQDRAGTPEGVYHLTRIERKTAHKADLEYDFPNEVDRHRYDFYLRNGMIPYPVPPIGKGSKIHGGGIQSNWTWGDIALRDQDIDWLLDRPEIKPGLEITIAGADLRPSDLSLQSTLTKEELEELKTMLTTLGYLTGPTANDWREAISLFQKDKGLTITGVLDEVTRARIVTAASGDYGLSPVLPRELGWRYQES